MGHWDFGMQSKFLQHAHVEALPLARQCLVEMERSVSACSAALALHPLMRNTLCAGVVQVQTPLFLRAVPCPASLACKSASGRRTHVLSFLTADIPGASECECMACLGLHVSALIPSNFATGVALCSKSSLPVCLFRRKWPHTNNTLWPDHGSALPSCRIHGNCDQPARPTNSETIAGRSLNPASSTALFLPINVRTSLTKEYTWPDKRIKMKTHVRGFWSCRLMNSGACLSQQAQEGQNGP